MKLKTKKSAAPAFLEESINGNEPLTTTKQSKKVKQLKLKSKLAVPNGKIKTKKPSKPTQGDFEDDYVSSDNEELISANSSKKSKENPATNGKSSTQKSSKKTKITQPKFHEPEPSSDDDVEEDGDKEVLPEPSSKKASKKKVKSKEEKVAQNHKASLNKLKAIDPEFYKFLEQNDKKLLNFNDDDLDGSDNEEEPTQADSESEDEDELSHKPDGKFEAGSDESDFEPDEAEASEDEESISKKGGTRLITLKLLKQWQAVLSSEKINVDVIKNVIAAVNSALLSISGEHVAGMQFKVEGSAVFNGVLQLCVLHLHPAVRTYLGLAGHTSKQPHKCKKWNKIRASLKDYFIDLTKLLEHVSSPNILIVLLKHLHQISPMIASFSSLTKPILKRLVVLWSTSEETVRVLAFLSILRITRGQQTSLLNLVLKAMYLSYVRNSKFVSPGTLPSINFMRRSLTEMFALDLNVSYQHVFLYIRQLAIHLRNALTLKKKDSFQAVYNWQFVNSLRLWVELLSATSNKTQLQPLLYPLVSIITGTIKLIPTAQFFPLRFHLTQILINLSKETNTFIPVMPYILEVLHSNTFNKKHSKVSMKPLSFTCILRLNKGQLLENGFRDEVIENIFGQTLEYLAHESATLSYPDMVVPTVINLKEYLKRCKNSNYSRKLKVLVDKIEETSRMVENERDRVQFQLKDTALITAWETRLRNKGTPMAAYYDNWVRTHINKKKRQAIDSENISDYNLPSIKRGAKVHRGAAGDGPVDLFPSDDEDDDELEVEKPLSKKAKHADEQPEEDDAAAEEEEQDEDDDDLVDSGVDIVKDLDLNDW